MNLSDYKGILVFIEQRESVIQKVSLELLGKGRELADELGGEVTALLLGQNISQHCQEMIHCGADKVVYLEDEALKIYTTEPYAQAMTAAIQTFKPEIVLVGATAIGRDLGPRVSARLETGLTADCTKLEIGEGNHLWMTRPAFGGNIMATIICTEHRPQMSTVRPGVMKVLPRNTARTGEVIALDCQLIANDLNVEVLEAVREEKKKVNIEDADILVSGGRGVGGKDNYGGLEALAKQLHGTVSSSRAAVDAGWMTHDRQVGQTGKTVRPDVYFACGISGAIQHVAGMEESEFIIAINKDPGAPVFDVADLGIVGDLHKIVPLLVDEVSAAHNNDRSGN